MRRKGRIASRVFVVSVLALAIVPSAVGAWCLICPVIGGCYTTSMGYEGCLELTYGGVKLLCRNAGNSCVIIGGGGEPAPYPRPRPEP
jgi:hypothetical protein